MPVGDAEGTEGVYRPESFGILIHGRAQTGARPIRFRITVGHDSKPPHNKNVARDGDNAVNEQIS
jgi:hypothetical protein